MAEPKPELVLPPNFKKMLVECVDPTQSTDYLRLGGKTFLVQVLPVGVEKKITRLSKIDLDNPDGYDIMLTRSVGEIVSFLEGSNQLDWPEQNGTRDELESFLLAFTEKIQYNDEIIKVVRQVQGLINWKPLDDKAQDDSARYITSHVFLPAMVYLNISEKFTPEYVFTKMTRGYIEIVKLNNMISNDRMKFTDKKQEAEEATSREMAGAKTADEYFASLGKQGFSVTDLMS